MPKRQQTKPEILPEPETILRLRYEHGLTQDGLAQKAGVSKRTIENLEEGASVRPDTLAVIAKALDVPASRLLKGSGVPEKYNQAKLNYDRAEELREKRNFDAAMFYYHEVPVLIGEAEQLSQYSYIGIAKIHRQNEEWDQAFATLAKVFQQPKVGDSHARAHYNYACYLHLSRHSLGEVLDELQKAFSVAPSANYYQNYALWEDEDFKSLRRKPAFRNAIDRATADER